MHWLNIIVAIEHSQNLDNIMKHLLDLAQCMTYK